MKTFKDFALAALSVGVARRKRWRPVKAQRLKGQLVSKWRSGWLVPFITGCVEQLNVRDAKCLDTLMTARLQGPPTFWISGV